MATVDSTQVVGTCIESLMKLASGLGGIPENGRIRTIVHRTLALLGPDLDGSAHGKALLKDSLRKNANLMAAASPEAAEVLMRAYRVATAL